MSNELPDAFGVHKVLLSAEGDAEAVVVVPRVECDVLASLPASLAKACRASDSQLRALFGWHDHPRDCFLGEAQLRELMEALHGADSFLVDKLWFEEALVPARLFPTLSGVLAAGAEQYALALCREASGVVQYVNAHAVDYVREVAPTLLAGQLMTIDYGDTTRGLVHGARRGKFPFRVYRDEQDYHPVPNDPYTRPGEQDLTADVNFTDLAHAGLSANLEVSYFGPERAVSGAELPKVLASTSELPFRNFVGDSVFKVLVLSRHASWRPTEPGLEPFDPFDGDQGLTDEQKRKASTIALRLQRGSPAQAR